MDKKKLSDLVPCIKQIKSMYKIGTNSEKFYNTRGCFSKYAEFRFTLRKFVHGYKAFVPIGINMLL